MLGILWGIVLVLFALWVIGLLVHWGIAAVWALFVIGVVLLVVSIVLTLFRDAFNFISRGFGSGRPTV